MLGPGIPPSRLTTVAATRTASGPARILLVDSIGYTAMGGAATVVNEVLERADRARHVPVLVCLSRGQWPDAARAKGISAYSLPRTRLRSVRNLVEVVGGLRRIIRDESIDLVHASENTALVYSGLACRLTRIPLVWHIHSPLQPRSREERLVARLLPHLGPRHVVFTSPAAQRKSIDFGAATTSVIFPGVDLEACRAGDGPRGRAGFGIPPEAEVVSMLARVVPDKGARTFVECAGALVRRRPNLWALLCGPGDRQGAFWRSLDERRRELGVEERLILPGDIRPPQRDDVVAMSDVVLHTSPAESFGLSVLEAMAAGKPVVSSDVDGPRILIDPGVDGLLVPSGDVAGFVDAVAALLDDPDRRRSLGDRAAATAARYPIDKTVGQVEDLWDELLAR